MVQIVLKLIQESNNHIFSHYSAKKMEENKQGSEAF